MFVRDFTADLSSRGLPVLGAGVGAVYAARIGGPWWHLLGRVALGWSAGWGVARTLRWLVESMAPQLPEDVAAVEGLGTGYGDEQASPGQATPAAMSGIRYVNLEQEKARLREEAKEKRRARRRAPVAEAPPSPQVEEPSTAIVPLAVKPSMVYSGLRVGKRTLGVSRPTKE